MKTMELANLDPFKASHKCYACDQEAVGFAPVAFGREAIQAACARHAWAKLGKLPAPLCMYCSQPTRKGSVVIDDTVAHQSCVVEIVKGTV